MGRQNHSLKWEGGFEVKKKTPERQLKATVQRGGARKKKKKSATGKSVFLKAWLARRNFPKETTVGPLRKKGPGRHHRKVQFFLKKKQLPKEQDEEKKPRTLTEPKRPRNPR